MAVKNLLVYNKADDGMALPLSISRGNPNPLDDTYLFKSYADAALYAASDPVAYVGQIVAVVENKQSTDKDGKPVVDGSGAPVMIDAVGAYLIVDTDGTLLELINTETSGDAALDLAKVKSQIAAIQALIGTDTLATTASTIIGAINEIAGAASSAGGAVTITTKTPANTGMQTTYVFEQDGTSIGEVDIPISSGGDGDSITLETDPDGNYVLKKGNTTIGTIPNLAGDIADIKKDISDIQTDVGTLQTDVGTLQSDVGTLKADVADNKKDIKDIKDTIGNTPLKTGDKTLTGAINEIYDKGGAPAEDEWATEDDIDDLYLGIFSGLGW